MRSPAGSDSWTRPGATVRSRVADPMTRSRPPGHARRGFPEESNMARAGWSKLIPDDDCFHGLDAYRIDAYSEYMPAPRVGWKPYGPVPVSRYVFSSDDPYGWMVHEFDEA